MRLGLCRIHGAVSGLARLMLLDIFGIARNNNPFNTMVTTEAAKVA